jgi:hypothetical protein
VQSGRRGDRSADTLHGVRVASDTRVEVVAECDIGTLYPVHNGDGGRRLVEVFRRDMPSENPV